MRRKVKDKAKTLEFVKQHGLDTCRLSKWIESKSYFTLETLYPNGKIAADISVSKRILNWFKWGPPQSSGFINQVYYYPQTK